MRAKRSATRTTTAAAEKTDRRPAQAAAANLAAPQLTGRCMYLWKLAPVLDAEGGIEPFVAKAVRAKLSSVWIKVAEGASDYQNVTGANTQRMRDVVRQLNAAHIRVWGWQVPHGDSVAVARAEAAKAADLAARFGLDGILMDAESEATFFRGGPVEATEYASQLRQALDQAGKGLAISSHDIPSNFENFPFDSFARHARVNAPQVYYGGSPSVAHRLDRAIEANHHLSIPFVPVGAGWIGAGGGCSSASACAERAVTFMRLVRQHGFSGYSFWHWFGAPEALWLVLFNEPV